MKDTKLARFFWRAAAMSCLLLSHTAAASPSAAGRAPVPPIDQAVIPAYETATLALG